ncbi:MAG: hypothetical protein RIF33_05855 [Cyclobacteriaceae bacterium]
MNNIIQVLDRQSQDIQHLKTAHLRADSLKQMLNLNLQNSTKIDFQNALRDTVFMVKTMDKMDSNQDLILCMLLLEHFVKTGNFNLTTIPQPYIKKELERFNEIKEKLRHIVILDSDEPTFF